MIGCDPFLILRGYRGRNPRIVTFSPDEIVQAVLPRKESVQRARGPSRRTLTNQGKIWNWKWYSKKNKIPKPLAKTKEPQKKKKKNSRWTKIFA